MAATVSTQLDAFASGDIAAAYELTSPLFRTTFDPVAFETLIRTQDPYLLESSGHRTDECWIAGSRGYLLAGVQVGMREVVLRYDVSNRTGGRWFIDGAAELTSIRLPETQLA
jgi:hypothetical protein